MDFLFKKIFYILKNNLVDTILNYYIKISNLFNLNFV